MQALLESYNRLAKQKVPNLNLNYNLSQHSKSQMIDSTQDSINHKVNYRSPALADGSLMEQSLIFGVETN